MPNSVKYHAAKNEFYFESRFDQCIVIGMLLYLPNFIQIEPHASDATEL